MKENTDKKWREYYFFLIPNLKYFLDEIRTCLNKAF